MCRGKEKCMQDFDGEKRRKETTWKTQALWENNIEMALKEIGWEGVAGIHLPQDMDT
jgi:hypothetical protein